MRISDWSSDVCSSDLAEEAAAEQAEAVRDVTVEIGGKGLELVGQEGRAVAELDQLERGRIVDPRDEAEQRVVHVRIVVMIAGRVRIVERERRFDRDIGLRTRNADEQVELETIGQPLFEQPRKMID